MRCVQHNIQIFYTQFDGTDKKNEIFYPEVGAYFIVVKWATNEQTGLGEAKHDC